MKQPQLLLAKRPRVRGNPREGETLLGHSMKALECFRLMFGETDREPTPLGNKWLRFFRLPPDAYAQFQVSGALAAALHDVGKANSGFQGMIARGEEQLLWHDHIGGLILSRDPIRQWIEGIARVQYDAVLVAVFCHHLRADRKTFPELSPDLQLVELHWRGIYELVEMAATQLGVISRPNLEGEEPVWSSRSGRGYNLTTSCDEFRRRHDKIKRYRMKEDEQFRRMVWALRSAIVAADSAASGVVREGMDLKEWVDAVFDSGMCLDGAAIQEKVILPRVQQIKAQKGSFAWTDFQEAADLLPKQALLIAPCGSGKTLAAWRWIKTQLDATPRSRVLFLYPTRATATEGFRDYVSWAPETDAALLTGTATYDLEGMFSNPEDVRCGRDYGAEERLFALSYWHRRVFSATVDQFLGFLQYAYGSMCLLPVLADSVVVIDEVHSFDINLFTALKGFLKSFDIPVLCMTASLPPNRRQALVEECGVSLFPQDISAFPKLEAMATMPRYRVRLIELAGAEQRVTEAMKEGKRVLWVVNTVSRCQEISRTWGALCYHSRFKLEDRKKHHQEVVKAFQQKRAAVLAVTTQVCEMSLDLDADILVTQVAPVTSLIQRMGRCNRNAAPGDGVIGEVYVYEHEDEKPYTTEDLSGTKEFLAAIDGRDVSQMRLEELLEQFGSTGFQPTRYTAFIESGPWATSREESLRAIEDFCLPGILDADRDEYFRRRRAKSPIDGLVVPVPRKLAKQDSRLGGFLCTAPGSHYDSRFGLMDHPGELTI